MKRVSRIARVHVEFNDELNKMWDRCGRQVTKVNLTRQIAHQLKQRNQKKPRYVVNYWPLSRKKVRVY